MADSGSKKKKRRARKGGGGGGSHNVQEKDGHLDLENILALVKEQLELAKASKDHDQAQKLREQVWVLTDMIAGVRTDLPEEELQEILKNLPIKDENSTSENSQTVTTTVLSEPEKRIRNLKKKLDQIEKLKAKQEKGEKLETNQMEKIQSEDKIKEEIKEMEQLIHSTLKLTL